MSGSTEDLSDKNAERNKRSHGSNGGKKSDGQGRPC